MTQANVTCSLPDVRPFRGKGGVGGCLKRPNQVCRGLELAEEMQICARARESPLLFTTLAEEASSLFYATTYFEPRQGVLGAEPQ